MGKRKRRQTTPLRRSLSKGSALLALVEDGIAALKRADRARLANEIRPEFGDSLDLDAAMLEGHEQEHRWDYLLGHTPSKCVIGIEPHSAATNEITTVIKKKEAAVRQLAAHLGPGKRVARWIWVASGKNHFADTEKARLRLYQAGIDFAGPTVMEKHLPR